MTDDTLDTSDSASAPFNQSGISSSDTVSFEEGEVDTTASSPIGASRVTPPTSESIHVLFVHSLPHSSEGVGSASSDVGAPCNQSGISSDTEDISDA